MVNFFRENSIEKMVKIFLRAESFLPFPIHKFLPAEKNENCIAKINNNRRRKNFIIPMRINFSFEKSGCYLSRDDFRNKIFCSNEKKFP